MSSMPPSFNPTKKMISTDLISWTTDRTWKQRRSLWSRFDHQSLKTRTRLSILCEMKRISYLWSIVGTRTSFLQWRRHAHSLKKLTSTLKLLKRDEVYPQKGFFRSYHNWRCYKWMNQTYAELHQWIWQIPETSWQTDNKNRFDHGFNKALLRLHFYFYFLTYSDNEHLLFVYFFQMNNAFALFPLLIKQ